MSILSKLLKYYILMISIFFIGRLSLFIIYWERIENSQTDYFLSFLYGLKMDTIMASMLLVIPLLLLSFTPKKWDIKVDKILRIYFLIIFILIIYIENATIPFFAEYDVRPNYKFVEYLVYPKEVFSMILTDYQTELYIAFGIIFIFSIIFWTKTKDSFLDILKLSLWKRALMFLPIAILLFIGIRSSFGHRPANISDALFSSSRLVNEITKNSFHSIVYSIYANQTYETKGVKKLYGEMDIDEALNRVSNRLGITNSDLKSKTSPFSRKVDSNFKSKDKKNIVIFLQESLGYQFISKELTPNLVKLKDEGLWFDELYSNGTRSIRGIAGVTSGILSVAGKGVVKRNKSQNNFFTFAKLLKHYGYKSLFLYGGEARFDNMKSWFLGNGFDEVIEEKDYVNPEFVATWGVSDEDLVNKANKRFEELYQQGQPFSALMFSSSNHSPFEYPSGRIKPIDKKEYSLRNAIKYADYAIGKFFKDAKKLDYYKDTIFVVVADHNVRVYGDDIVPVDMFHIPALIIGEDVTPQIYSKQASQPDVLATLLDYIGKDFKYPILGNSIFSDNKKDINLMQFNENYALRVEDEVAVITPNKSAETFNYKNKRLIKTKHNKELEQDVLAFITVLDYLYHKQLFK
ncbi:Phosphoglycerol transferase I [hydrothermal vent metagenome]|uniref:Phosphoglycerol transferase I n=1 Tax=hydrothermal vent metagenome TaxID=652676 RepID=A0A1W1C3V1_9ZZZZ